MELDKWVKKQKISTLWPKEWNMNKIKKITKESSENVQAQIGSKYWGEAKDGTIIIFFSKKKGVINNAFIDRESLNTII